MQVSRFPVVADMSVKELGLVNGAGRVNYQPEVPMFTIGFIIQTSGGRGSSVCKATCYGLDGPGIESRWG